MEHQEAVLLPKHSNEEVTLESVKEDHFRDVTPFSLVDIYQRFGEICFVHLHRTGIWWQQVSPKRP
jgi:hypothetical protein